MNVEFSNGKGSNMEQYSNGKEGNMKHKDYEKQSIIIDNQLDQSQAIDTKKENKLKIDVENKDVIFGIACLVLGFMFWNLNSIIFLSGGIGTTVFSIIICLITFCYLKNSGNIMHKRSLITLTLLFAVALSFTLFDQPEIKPLLFVFLIFLFIYWVCQFTGQSLDDKISKYIAGDVFNQTIAVPFGSFFSLFRSLNHGIKNNKASKDISLFFIGFIVTIPIVIIVVSQLINADAIFEGYVTRLIEAVSFYKIIEYGMQIVFGIPVACYIYGLITSDAKGIRKDTLNITDMDNFFSKMASLPAITGYALLIALNVVYGIFIYAQSTYFFSAFYNLLPETMTYAEYARTGFFELCKVSVINFFVIATVSLFIKKKQGGRFVAVLTGMLTVLTILIICTALSKMIMYINYYGLTQLRVYTSIFMCTLMFVFLVIFISQFVRINIVRIIIIGTTIVILATSYGNVDGQIARYNIERYEEGSLEELDMDTLFKLSDAAIPYAYELWKDTDDLQLKNELWSNMTGIYADGTWVELPEKKFRNFNLQSYRADKICEELKKTPPEEITALPSYE